MTLNATQNPVPLYVDVDGTPLDNGSIYYGIAGQNPETAPTTVYWDAAGTQPAAQPIKTLNGQPSRAGTPAIVYTGSDYSTTVRNKRGALVSSFVNALGFGYIAQIASSVGASLVGYLPSGAGALATTVQQQLRNIQGFQINVKDAPYYAKCDGVTDDTAAVQLALDTGKLVHLTGKCKLTGTVTIPSGGGICGDGASTGFIRAFSGGRLISYPGSAPIILRDFVIDTQAGITVASTDTGIDVGWSSGWAGQGDISNIVIQNQWDGLRLNHGSFNVVNNVQAILNRGHGFHMINARGPLSNCLAQYNFGDGFHYNMASTAETGMQMTACGTFGNKGYGFYFGAAAGVSGANVWLTGCSSSTDGAGGIIFAAKYYQTLLEQVFIESAGTAYIPFNANNPTLPPWTAVTNAPGLVMQSGCLQVMVSGLYVQTCNGNGIYLDGVNYATFNNVIIQDCGLGAAGAPNQTGLTLAGSGTANSNITFLNLLALYGASQTVDVSLSSANNTNILFGTSQFRTYSNSGAAVQFADMPLTTATNSVASANVLTVPDYTNFVNVTGTTTINAMTVSWAGRQVVLKFAASLTVADGNNLKLSGPYGTSADDTLTLMCDGTNWFEISRSAN